MITFLASPKAFTGAVAGIQVRAIRSWREADPEAEIVLFGRGAGGEEAARDLGVRQVLDIECSESGVPYFSAIVEWGRRFGGYDWQVYLNCDIVVTRALPRFLRALRPEPALVIGQRLDLADGVVVEDGSAAVLEGAREAVAAGRASLHPPAGSDYFAFRRDTWEYPPRVIIGRGGYDNALIRSCLDLCIPVIDGTKAVPAIHQFHGYGHLPGGVDEVFRGADVSRNLESVPGSNGVTLEDATWEALPDGSIARLGTRGDWMRRLGRRMEGAGAATLGRWTLGPFRRGLQRIGISCRDALTARGVLDGWVRAESGRPAARPSDGPRA
jgi:hypothetical protein